MGEGYRSYFLQIRDLTASSCPFSTCREVDAVFSKYKKKERLGVNSECIKNVQ